MANPSYEPALAASLELLALYSPQKLPRFAGRPTLELLQPERRIREALAEAQFVLNMTSQVALEKRGKFLRSSANRQLTINILHFVTGSGFISLIALNNPEFIKWLGAAVSLVAGIVALLLPKDMGALEQQLTEDISKVSDLAGEIASIQTELIVESDFSNKELIKRIAQTISKCVQLSKKYELDQLAALHNYNLHSVTDKAELKESSTITPGSDNPGIEQ